MNFYVMTLFPRLIDNIVSESIIGRGIERGIISVNTVNIRDYTKNKHNRVDDYCYGGGAGMLMQVEPIHLCHRAIIENQEKKIKTVYLTPWGRKFDMEIASELSKEEDLILLCGHYEGVDERALELICDDYISIGDYVLTGGELAAAIVIDSVSRLVPGVLNNHASSIEESFDQHLLEHPQYTRPAVYENMQVPEVLLSGNPKKISEWKLQESIKRTKKYRPDLYEEYLRENKTIET